MGKREYISLTLILIFILAIYGYKQSLDKKRLKFEEAKKNLVEVGKQVEQYYQDAPSIPDFSFPTPNEEIKPKVWDFTQKQPDWILLPKPDYDEQSDKGLNLRINPNQSVTLTNNKETWSSSKYRAVTLEYGPVFEKVDMEITLINESGSKSIFSQKLLLNEKLISVKFSEDKAYSGNIKEISLRFKNTDSRNQSSFDIKRITLSY